MDINSSENKQIPIKENVNQTPLPTCILNEQFNRRSKDIFAFGTRQRRDTSLQLTL